MRSARALNVGFLWGPLGSADRKAVMAFTTRIAAFHLHGREVYWLCRQKQGESTFSNAGLEQRLGVRATFRGMNTVVRLAAKLSGSPA